MPQGTQVMQEQQFAKNARSAWRTVTNGYRTAVTEENGQELRKQWAAEMAELFGGKVTIDAVFQRLNNLRSSGHGGLPPVPQGQRGRAADPSAIKADLEAEIAELKAAGFTVELDDKGNIANVIPPSAE